jgi:hypothetical protein
MLGASTYRPKPRLYVEGREVTDTDELRLVRIEQEEKVEARKAAAMRELAQLSAQHPLSGYDRNVIQQWIDAGACGRRPELSFEILRNFRSVHEIAAEEAARHELSRRRAAAAEKLRSELREKKKARSGKTRERRCEWDELHPVAAKVRDERRAVVKERRAAAFRQRQQELAEEAQVQRVMRFTGAGGKAAVLQLNEEDFDQWMRHASTEALEAFGEDLLKDGKKLRDRNEERGVGALWRLAQVMHWLGSRL